MLICRAFDVADDIRSNCAIGPLASGFLERLPTRHHWFYICCCNTAPLAASEVFVTMQDDVLGCKWYRRVAVAKASLVSLKALLLSSVHVSEAFFLQHLAEGCEVALW